MSTIFPEVRLKRYWRCAAPTAGRGGGCALPAFWVGLLYDDASLDAAWDLVKDWTAAERQTLRDDVPRLGFKAEIRGRAMLDLAKECLALAEAGLKRRGYRDSEGRDETRYLTPLQEFVRAGSRRPKNFWKSTTARGASRSSRCSPSMRLAASSDHPMTQNPRRLIALAFSVGMLVWSLGLFGPAAILPYLQSERGWPVALISAAITAHFLTSALVVAVMPEIHRAIGVRGTVLAGAAAVYAGFIVWATVPSPYFLFAAALISGAVSRAEVRPPSTRSSAPGSHPTAQRRSARH